MATRTAIIAWRWRNLNVDVPNYINVSTIGNGGVKRQLIQFKERRMGEPDLGNDKTLQAIKKEIKTNLDAQDDDVIVFLHKQKIETLNNGMVAHSGYTHASRHAVLAMNTEANPQRIRCVLFENDSFLYRKMLNSNGDFGIVRITLDGVTSPKPLYENEVLDNRVFDKVWREYLKEYVDYADNIKSLFKNCLNHWLELPDSASDIKHPMNYWRDELMSDKTLYAHKTLYDHFAKFLKFSPDPHKETPTHDAEELIYQKSIALIVSDSEAKKAYQYLQNIIKPPPDLERQVSLRDIHQNMDKIRRRLA